MTKTLQWGLLSTARINRRLIPPLGQATRSRLNAVASRNIQTAQAFAQQWNIPRAFNSYEAILADPDIDVVYIPLPNSLHCEWAVKAAEAGKHILCEKPLALSVAEVDRMARAAAANNVVLVEAFMYRMHPQIAKIKELIAGGLIGPIKFIKATFSFMLDEPTNIRLQPDMGGGSLWDVGCYPISFSQAIAGADPVEVFGWQRLNENGIETLFAGQLKFADGLLSQIDSSFELPFRARAEIAGEKGSLLVPRPFQPDLDGKRGGLIHVAPDDTETRIEVVEEPLYLGEVEVMERAILDGVQPPYTLGHSRGNIATINALYRSAQTGRAVKLD